MPTLYMWVPTRVGDLICLAKTIDFNRTLDNIYIS